MKKSIPLILATLTFFVHIIPSVQAQDLTKPGNQWNIAIYPSFSPNSSSYSLRIGEDTLVNMVLYKKIYYSSDSLNTNWSLTHRYLREDSTRRVFYKDGNDDEVLLYDFNLEVNDTFQVVDFCNLQVVEVDTVILNNGAPKKRMQLVNTEYPDEYGEIWIEGIGSDLGVLSYFGLCVTDFDEGLLCFYTNDELLYPASPPSCFITGVEELPEGETIKVYPIPLQNILYIEDPDSRLADYTLYNESGKILKTGNMLGTMQQVEWSDLPAGHYVLVLSYKNGSRYVKRVTKI